MNTLQVVGASSNSKVSVAARSEKAYQAWMHSLMLQSSLPALASVQNTQKTAQTSDSPTAVLKAGHGVKGRGEGSWGLSERAKVRHCCPSAQELKPQAEQCTASAKPPAACQALPISKNQLQPRVCSQEQQLQGPIKGLNQERAADPCRPPVAPCTLMHTPLQIPCNPLKHCMTLLHCLTLLWAMRYSNHQQQHHQ